MFRFLILKFWPVLIPITIYVLWWLYVKRKKKGEAPAFAARPFWISVYASIVLLVMSLAYYFIQREVSDGEYIPSRMENGKLIRGQVIEKNNETQ